MTEQKVDPNLSDQNLDENQSTEKKWLSGFMKWFNKFTSKVQEKAKSIWNPLDKVAWKVTGVLDKVEQKFTEISGVNLDSLATMPKKEEKKADDGTENKTELEKEVE